MSSADPPSVPATGTGDGSWAVVLEVAAPGDGPVVELTSVQRLVAQLGDWRPKALYNPDRYAIQLELFALDLPRALLTAVDRHAEACRRLRLAAWPLVRAEVLTSEELEANLAAEDERMARDALPATGRPGGPSDALHQATRSLLGVTGAAEARAVLIRFVFGLGGQIAVGDTRPDPSIIPLDLSLGEGGGLFAVAEPLSVARMLLEESLPLLLEDARRVVGMA